MRALKHTHESGMASQGPAQKNSAGIKAGATDQHEETLGDGMGMAGEAGGGAPDLGAGRVQQARKAHHKEEASLASAMKNSSVGKPSTHGPSSI